MARKKIADRIDIGLTTLGVASLYGLYKKSHIAMVLATRFGLDEKGLLGVLGWFFGSLFAGSLGSLIIKNIMERAKIINKMFRR